MDEKLRAISQRAAFPHYTSTNFCSPSSSSILHSNKPTDPTRPGNSTDDVPTQALPVLTMFCYLNIRGLVPQTVPSKVPYIKDELSTYSAAIFPLTETWLTKSHLAAVLHIDGYSIFRQDRQRKKAKSGRNRGGCTWGTIAPLVQKLCLTSAVRQ